MGTTMVRYCQLIFLYQFFLSVNWVAVLGGKGKLLLQYLECIIT